MSSASPKASKAQEPTMEDILASIRRIIADEQAAPPADEPEEDAFEAPAAKATPASDGPNDQSAVDDMFDNLSFDEDDAEEDEEEVLDLGKVAEPILRTPDDLKLEHEDIDFREAVEEEEPEPEPEEDPFEEEEDFDEPEPAYVPPPMPPPPPRPRFEERLVSDATDAAVGGSFNLLAHAVLTNQGRTLDDLVKEMLRPMLKDWLDDNLPTIVERLVRAEIERVSRGR